MARKLILQYEAIPCHPPQNYEPGAFEEVDNQPSLRYRRRFVLLSVQITFVVLCLTVSMWRNHPSISSSPVSTSLLESTWASELLQLPPPKAKYLRCTSASATLSRDISFNLTTVDSNTTTWKILDTAPPELRGRLRGEIRVDRGKDDQTSDIEVHATILAEREENLDKFHLRASESGLGVHYDSQEEDDSCTEVKILVHLRPWPKRLLDVLEIRSHVLDVALEYSLNWEVNNLLIHTSHGDTDFEASYYQEPLITHNISVSSETGDLFGRHMCDGNLEFKNIEGSIGFQLGPRYTGPFKPESISVSTVSGDIFVEGVYPYWPSQPLQHTTNIWTTSGNIWGQLPHGKLTNVTNVNGNIKVAIRPFGATKPDDPSEVHTRSQSGTTWVWLEDAPLDSVKGHYNPLLNTISSHHLDEGKMILRYGYSWYGNMEGRIDDGPLSFDSSALDKLERAEGYVKAKRVRGQNGKSWMEARVGKGEMNIDLGL